MNRKTAMAGLCVLVFLAGAAVAQPATQRSIMVKLSATSGRSVEFLLPPGPTLPAAAIAFSSDGKSLVSGAFQEVLVWDLGEARLARRIGTGQITDLVQAIAIRKGGKMLAVAEGVPGKSGAMRLFDWDSGNLSFSFDQIKDVVYAVAFSPDGRLVVAGGADNAVYVWNVNEKKLLTTLKDHSGPISGVAFSPDGKLLASASADHTAQVWLVEDFKSIAKFQQADALQGITFGIDGEMLLLAVGGTTERAVRTKLVEIPTTAPADPSRRRSSSYSRTYDTAGGSPQAVVFAGGKIFVPCSDGVARIYDTAPAASASLWPATATRCAAQPLRADNTRIATGSANGAVRVWNAADGKLLATFIQLAPRTDRWLIVSASGHFAASNPAGVKWKANGIAVPPDKLAAELGNSELVKQALAGKAVPPAGSGGKP